MAYCDTLTRVSQLLSLATHSAFRITHLETRVPTTCARLSAARAHSSPLSTSSAERNGRLGAVPVGSDATGVRERRRHTLGTGRDPLQVRQLRGTFCSVRVHTTRTRALAASLTRSLPVHAGMPMF